MKRFGLFGIMALLASSFSFAEGLDLSSGTMTSGGNLSLNYSGNLNSWSTDNLRGGAMFNFGYFIVDNLALAFDIGAAGANTSSEPVLVTRTPSNSFVANGALTLVFDREVKVLTSTLAAGGGGLNVLFAPGVKSDGTACTTAEIGNPVANATTPVTVAISGRIVTITPNFTGGSGAYTPPATCGGASVTYTINTLQFFAVEPNIPSAYTFTDGAVTIETTRRLVN